MPFEFTRRDREKTFGWLNGSTPLCPRYGNFWLKWPLRCIFRKPTGSPFQGEGRGCPGHTEGPIRFRRRCATRPISVIFHRVDLLRGASVQIDRADRGVAILQVHLLAHTTACPHRSAHACAWSWLR